MYHCGVIKEEILEISDKYISSCITSKCYNIRTPTLTVRVSDHRQATIRAWLVDLRGPSHLRNMGPRWEGRMGPHGFRSGFHMAPCGSNHTVSTWGSNGYHVMTLLGHIWKPRRNSCGTHVSCLSGEDGTGDMVPI